MHKIEGEHVQCVNNYYAKSDYEGMITIRVTDYTNLPVSTHFGWKSVWMGDSGIYYSLTIRPIFHLIKILVIHYYLLKIRKVAKRSDYSLFIIFFLQFI